MGAPINSIGSNSDILLQDIASIESISFAIATLFAAVGGPPANRKTPPGILQCQHSSLMAEFFLLPIWRFPKMVDIPIAGWFISWNIPI
jgi:hypothetical protein